MKFTYIYDRTKEVLYGGVKIRISRYHDWMAADEEGAVYSYRNKPSAYESAGEWHDGGKPCYVGETDLQNTDWTETLEYVGEEEE